MSKLTPIHNASTSGVQEYSFDAWGRRRNPTDWSYTLTGQPELFADRGFTSHEFLKYFNIYNMNGRLYDPLVGRFLNPDNVIQDPTSTQNFNRYSYCLNNPLKYTDPSGNTYKEYMDNLYGEGNYWYRGQAPGTWGGEGSHGGGGGGGGSATGRGPTYGAPSYEDWARKKNAETTWVQLGFFYRDKDGNPIIKDEFSGVFWIYEATLNNYSVNSTMGYAPNRSFAQSSGVNNVSNAGLIFIAKHEGYSSTIYKDAGGYPTIGYGHLILPGENYNKGITKPQGLKLLVSDSQNAVNIINRLVTTSLNQNQFDALTSYVFNTGSLNGTNLLRNLNTGNFSGAASEMDIITSGGNIVNGLIIRRQDEQKLFLYGKY